MDPELATNDVLMMADEMLMPTYAPLHVVPASGHGSRITDADGKSYVDLGGGIALAARGQRWWCGRMSLMAKRWIDRRWLGTYVESLSDR